MSSRRQKNKKGFGENFNNENGVIVEYNLEDADAPIVFTIVDFKKNQSCYALRNCYKPPSSSSSDGKEKMAFKVLDNIKYEADGKNIIRQQISQNNYYKTQYTCKQLENGVKVVKATCVFSPDTPTKCFTDICGEIDCPAEISSKVLYADVTFDCWLEFSFVAASNVDLGNPSISPITYKFRSLEKVCPKFEFVYEAPWNKNAPRRMYDLYDPYTDSYPSAEPKKIYSLRAYYLSHGEIYIPSKPRIAVLIPYAKLSNDEGIELTPYMPILVNICYNELLKRFFVYEMKNFNGSELEAILTEDNFHKVNISPISKCPGFFCFGKNGLVHDKYGQLGDFYNLENMHSSVFSYCDPDEHAYTPLEIPQANKILLSKLQQIIFDGIYIGKKEFFSPHLHYCLIFASEDGGDDYKIGYWYKLTVQTLDDEKNIVNVSATLVEEYEHIPSKKIENDYEFLVEITIESVAIFQFVVASFLGAIGIKDADAEKCFNGTTTIGACAIQFPPPKELPEHRPQIRPIMIKGFEDVQNGMLAGNYK